MAYVDIVVICCPTSFFRAMNTHLPAILMSTRGIGFWPIPTFFFWLVVSTILKNMSSSMGRIIPYIAENKSHVWNHQPDKWDISNCLPRFWWLESIDSIFLYHTKNPNGPPKWLNPIIGFVDLPNPTGYTRWYIPMDPWPLSKKVRPTPQIIPPVPLPKKVRLDP